MTKVTMLAPDAYRIRHPSGRSLYGNQYFYNDTTPNGRYAESWEPMITTTQAEAYANARVREALEEAANKVADPVNIEATIENFGWVSHGNYVRAHLILRDAVEAIRALIPKEPPCDT